MKRFLQILFTLLIIGFVVGFFLKSQVDKSQALLGEKVIGITVLVMAFILFPFFIYHRSKGKKLSDYTLTKENLDKINKNKAKNKLDN